MKNYIITVLLNLLSSLIFQFLWVIVPSGSFVFILFVKLDVNFKVAFMMGFIAAVVLWLTIKYVFPLIRSLCTEKINPKPFVPKSFEDSLLFFETRLAFAFPEQTHGYKEYYGKDAVKRLSLVLANPISFDRFPDPIWYFRDLTDMRISGFNGLRKNKCVVKIAGNVFWNLSIKRIVVFSSQNSYHQNCIYVETESDKPSGVYSGNHAYEEYGVLKKRFKNVLLTRSEYDNGYKMLRGKPVPIKGAELHVRYIEPYNFIITSKASSLNSSRFLSGCAPFFDGLLNGSKGLEDFYAFIKTFRKGEH